MADDLLGFMPHGIMAVGFGQAGPLQLPQGHKGDDMTPDGPVAIMVRLTARPGCEDKVWGAVSALIEPIRQHPHCLYYDFHVRADDPASFVSYEVWTSLENFRTHLASPFIAALQESAWELLEHPLAYDILYSVRPARAGETVPFAEGTEPS
jgi:quinol monooxygenase YgiN